MKRMLSVCILAACCCSFAFANADLGTVANMPKSAGTAVTATAKVDLDHMTVEKALIYVTDMQRNGTLNETDPVYLWLKNESLIRDSRNGGSRLDQGNDNCPAVIIPSAPYSDNGSTVGLANDFTCAGNVSPDVVYQYTATAAGLHTVQTCGGTTNYDTRLEVRSGACPGAANLCNDDYCGLQSRIDVNLNIGDVITIVVDGYSSNSGNYTLSLSAPQPIGRCCYNSGFSCVDAVTQSDCQSIYGSNDWIQGASCTSNPCTPPVCTPDYVISPPYNQQNNTCGAGDDCPNVYDGDHIYQINITTAGDYNIWLCDESGAFWDSYICLGTTCCGSEIICRDDGGCGPNNYYLSRIDCLPLGVGTYYLAVGGLYNGACGVYTLQVFQCTPPVGRCCYSVGCSPACQDVTQAECGSLGGSWDQFSSCASNPCPAGGGSLRTIYVPVPTGLGVSIAVDCRGTLIYNNYGEGLIHKVDAFGNPVAAPIPMMDAAGNLIRIDEWGWDEGNQLLWGGEQNTNAIWTVDPTTGLATYKFAGCPGIGLTDGCDFDPHDQTIWHSPDVNPSACHYDQGGLLLGSLTVLDGLGNPDGSQSGIEVGVGNTIYVGHNGLGYITWNDKTTGARLSILAVVGGRDEGLACDAINFAPQNVLWTKGAYDGSLTALCIPESSCVCAQLPDTCQFPYETVDMGDLQPCNYPTLPANPGHGLSGIAWLGQCVDGEAVPNILDADACDDGVLYVGLPWMPCTAEQVRVTVTAGPAYGRYEDCGGRLYLNGWKDGNVDGDFCDEIPCGPALASEWIVRDVLVVPGAWNFTVLDPGVLDHGVYDGVFRWRLTHEPVGRYGYGLDIPGVCGVGCGTYAFSYLGEVEDYIIDGGQLSAELTSYRAMPGSNSVTLQWTTASETNNDRFEILKNGTMVGEVAGAGTTADRHDYSWTDREAVNGTTYTYSLVTVDASGNRETVGTVEATPSATSAVVSEYALHQNFPNPFNPETSIMFDLVEAGNVKLSVINVLGQSVATVVNGRMEAGRHTVNFRAGELPSGVYLYTIEVNGFMAQKKMVLMK